MAPRNVFETACSSSSINYYGSKVRPFQMRENYPASDAISTSAAASRP